MPTRAKRPARQQPRDEGLKLDEAHALAVLDKAVEYEVIEEDAVPDDKRKRISAATQQIDMLIEAWTKGGINPYSDDSEKAEMGKAIQDILDLAGVEIDEEGEVTFGPLPELEEGEPDASGGGEGEAAVDIEDIIEGYAELTAASRCKAIDALELDMNDDDDYNKAVAIYEWEEAQEKPSSRVLNFLDEILPQQGEEGAEGGDESAEEAGDGDGEEQPWEQPWTKKDGAPADYEKMTAVNVKEYLDKMLARDELSVEMLDYVADYEEQRKQQTRSRIMDHINKLRGEIGGEAPAEEEAPRSARPTATQRSRSGGRLSGLSQQEEEPEPSANGTGVFIVSGGDEDSEVTAYGYFQASGTVADLLMQGYTEVTVTAG